MLEIHRCPSDTVLDQAVKEVKNSLTKLLAENRDVLLLLSGGANIEVAKQAGLDLLNHSHVTALVLDERFSRDPHENNSLQLQAEGINVVPTIPKVGETLEVFGQRFSALFENWLNQHPQGKIVCTLGMGPDGHIAGISPLPLEPERFQQLFIQTKHLAVGYSGLLVPPARATVTAEFLRRIDVILAFIAGAAKQEAFSTLFDSSILPHEKPVKLLLDLPGKVVITTDLSTSEAQQSPKK